jgi:hypothetical protein
LVFFFLFTVCSFGQITVKNLTDTATLKVQNPVIFCLPKTRIFLEISVEKRIFQKGPFSDFAGALLGMTDVVTENNAIYSIRDVQLSTNPEPDPTQYYSISQKKCFFGHHAHNKIILTNEGFLRGMNLRNLPELKSFYPDHERFNPEHLLPVVESTEDFAYQLNNRLIDPPKEVIPIADSNGNVIPFVMPPKVKKEQSMEEKAKEAAKDLAQIRDNRNKLLSGYQETNYEKGTLELMTTQLKLMEEKILTMFKGTIRKEMLSYKFTYCPEITDSLPASICYFSPKQGITETNTANSDLISLSLSKKFPPEINDTITSRKARKNMNDGLPYRIPANADLSVFLANKTIFMTKLLIPQLGRVARLPYRLRSVEYYPETGGIKTICR